MKQWYLIILALILSLCATAQQNYPVRFDWGTVFFPENYTDVLKKNELKSAEVINGRYVRFIQCTRVPDASLRSVAEAGGVEFLGYLQVGAYLISLPEQYDLAKLAPLQVRSIVPVQAAWKMARSLREQPYGAWAVHEGMIDLNVQVYPHISIARGAELCRQNGFTVLQEGNQNGYLELRLPIENIDALSSMPFIRYLELVPPPGEPEDTRGRSLHRANLVDSDHAFGKHYNGDGVRVMVRDDGIVGPHADFKGRLDNRADLNDVANHADWVSGAMAGAGNIDPRAKGMAPGAKVYVVDYNPSFQDQTLNLHLDENVTITNTSYSNNCNAGYTLFSQTVDDQMFEHPTLTHVFSAGNMGTANCQYGAGSGWGNITGGHKMAKNAFLVANLIADGTLSNSSSRGPAYDGRLKPDISAMGTDVFMTQPNNTYSSDSGTSFSAPAVAGCLAQLTQAFKVTNNGQEPSAALLKAAVLNTANDLGNVGPDFKFGWGHINTWRALRLLEENRWTPGQTDQGGLDTHTLQIPGGLKQARVMIYWTEPPAEPNAAVSLINDLDLSLLAPDGTVLKPWLLNPNPLISSLNAPATTGRDSLNNMEQVAINNPAAGQYTVRVAGTAVPFGPQSYMLVWEFIDEAVKITYPAGGEGFVPLISERIHWDAYGVTENFTLRYSANNGDTWTTIATVNAGKRLYDWVIPDVVSGRVLLSITRGLQSDTTDYAFNIAPRPINLSVDKVCPDSMTVSWFEGTDSLSYDVYLLGKKYMEIVGTTGGLSYTFPILDAGQEQWFSVRCSQPGGLTGARAIAMNWPGGLKNCDQAYDLTVKQLESPDPGGVIACGSTEKTLSVLVQNTGLNDANGAIIHFQIGQQAPVSEALPFLAAGAFVTHTFQSPVLFNTNGTLPLKIWTEFPTDIAPFNDTLKVSLRVATQPFGAYFTEDFESSPQLPLGWTLQNPDNDLGWQLVKYTGLIGAGGSSTRALVLNCYSYDGAFGAEDYTYLVPMDFSGLDNPSLIFDIAYAPFGTSSDSVRVEVFPGCDLTAPPVVLWAKGGAGLATDVATNVSFYPNAASDWRTEVVALGQFAGQSLLIRFASVNDFGNNIYLDNIGIQNLTPVQPDAHFSASVDSICRLDTIYYQALTTEPSTDLSWSFGLQALPVSAIGAGPHAVRYVTPGIKTVSLIATNPFGADTIIQLIEVLNFPTANFTTQVNAQTVAFTNTSSNALSYLWAFGDGANSTATNPVHTYPGSGAYTVTLTSTNECKVVTKVVTVMTTSGVSDLSAQFSLRILPNPTEGDFRVEIQSQTAPGPVLFQLFDAQGRLVKTVKTIAGQTITSIPFEGLHLPKGLYQLRVETDKGVGTWKIAVQ